MTEAGARFARPMTTVPRGRFHARDELGKAGRSGLSLTAWNPRDSVKVMVNRIGVPIGAGLASALLFVVTAKGTALAMALAYLAPLPIMIAALGWGALSGAVACGVACACVAVVVEPLSGLLFAVTIALPGWALASFAILPGARLPWRKGAAPPSEWMSVGAIVTLAAALGALVSLGALVALIVVYGGYDKGLQSFADALEPAIEEATGGGRASARGRNRQ